MSDFNPYAPPESSEDKAGVDDARSSYLGTIVYLIGWSWPITLGLCGVAADRVHISSPLKVVLTSASLLLPVLVVRYGGRWRWGCGLFLGSYCLLGVMVMWFWN
jgi:hypothetical protein